MLKDISFDLPTFSHFVKCIVGSGKDMFFFLSFFWSISRLRIESFFYLSASMSSFLLETLFDLELLDLVQVLCVFFL